MSERDQLYGPLFDYMRRSHGTYMWNLGYWHADTRSMLDAQQNLVELCLQAMSPGEEQRILEVGCGVGGVLASMAARHPTCRFVGITVRQQDVERGARVLGELGASGSASIVLGDAQRIPFEDESFDHVLCLESAFHYASKEAFLGEAFRVLKPGGRLILADILFRNDTVPLALAQWFCNRSSGQHFRSAQQWDGLIASSGFRRAVRFTDFTEFSSPHRPVAASLRSRARAMARRASLPLHMLHWRRGRNESGRIVTTLMRWGILRYALWVLERPSMPLPAGHP
ncbi:MAG TPA: methyltransferase domain-containing protein [Myxococcus sp.]|nr:methyltransferase domain-containing protein [Myxococcus sp.]